MRALFDTLATGVRLLLLSLLLLACDDSRQQAPATATAPAVALEVSVLELQPRPWQYSIHAFGRLVAAEKVVIGVERAGTVARVLFKEGQKIVAGQVLLQLEDRKQLLRLERASADVASTRAELSRAESTFKRYQALMGQQVISEDDYKQKESAYNAALAQLQQVMAVEKLAQQELRDLTLISPVSGIVEVESVEPGQKVHPGQQLAVVQTANSMQVLSYVTEKEVNLLHVGDVAPMRTPGVPGRNYEARIESIGSTADSRTGNFAVKLRVDNGDGLLREGMSAHIQLQGDQGRDRLALPRSAVVDRDRRRVVFLVRDGRAVAVAPSLGMAMGDWIPVLSGLSAGDQVVIDQLALLADGSPVQARPVMDVAPMR